MELLLLMPLLFGCGYLFGRWHNRRWRRDRAAALGRKYQLIAERIENNGIRHKGKRPSLKPWQKWLLGLLHWWSPTLTRYTLFRPETLIGWFNRYVRCYWWLISSASKLNLPGRPRIAESVEQIIIDIKLANPRYGAERIAALVSKQLDMPVSESTVRNVLRRHLGKSLPPKPSDQTWKTFLKNHREFLASMDFKVTFDWRARPLYILCVLSHHRRQLIHCRCTYHPSAEWVAQQMREAFPFDEAPAKMLMDHDSIFLPVIKSTLPAMGIGVVRTTVKRPWQNGTIERFNRTLKEELLAHIIPISDGHLNRLLGEFKTFYNTARPHQANDGLAPDQLIASNDVSFVPDSLRVEEIPWLAGLHHSYRRVV